MEVSHVVLLCFLFIALIYVFTQNPIHYRPIFSFQNHHCQSSLTWTNTSNTNNRDELETVLSMASSGNNKTVIIAVVNKAYVEGDKPMLDLFLKSFWLGEDTQGLINHLVLVTVDHTSYRRCMFLRLNCYKLETDGVDFKGEKLYMSNEFIKMMWRRTLFLGEVVKRGYNFIFTDTDIVWLRNPFPRLMNNNASIDIQISTDKFDGNPWSEANLINTGFYMVVSNNKTVALFDEWYARKNDSVGMKEQDVLQKMIHDGALTGLNLKLKFLDTLYFSGFCQDSKDFTAVTTVHANCCRTINAKVADLSAVIRDWKRFTQSLSTYNYNQTSTIMKWSNHVACLNSWRNKS